MIEVPRLSPVEREGRVKQHQLQPILIARPFSFS